VVAAEAAAGPAAAPPAAAPEAAAAGPTAWALLVATSLAKQAKDALKAAGWLDTAAKAQVLPGADGQQQHHSVALPLAPAALPALQQQQQDAALHPAPPGARQARQQQAQREALELLRPLLAGGAARLAQLQLGRSARAAAKPPAVALHEAVEALLQQRGLQEQRVAALLAQLPRKWEKLGDLALIPADAMADEAWAGMGQEVWAAVTGALRAARLARQRPVASTGVRCLPDKDCRLATVPPGLLSRAALLGGWPWPCRPAARLLHFVWQLPSAWWAEVAAQWFRAWPRCAELPPPRVAGVVVSRHPACGGRGALGCAAGTRDSRAELLLGADGWVEHLEHGVTFCLDVTRCMFSSGGCTRGCTAGRPALALALPSSRQMGPLGAGASCRPPHPRPSCCAPGRQRDGALPHGRPAGRGGDSSGPVLRHRLLHPAAAGARWRGQGAGLRVEPARHRGAQVGRAAPPPPSSTPPHPLSSPGCCFLVGICEKACRLAGA
jgi:tRNA G37 N-methylase Trm5